MPNLSVKRRLMDAKKAAKIKCESMGYSIINSDNHIFCFIASRSGIYQRKIRVVIDDITERDIKVVKDAVILLNETKEIWCRTYRSRKWKIIEFDKSNNPVNH